MKLFSCAFLAAILSLVLASPSYAQASRTWVSGVGDDANPCSRTAPCKTFAGAISKTAVNGEINTIDAGGFGALTITKSITIDGGTALAGILASGVNGIVINAAGSKVVLRNLEINGFGTGIDGVKLVAGGQLSLDNVRIWGFTQQGVNLAPSSGNVDFDAHNVYVHDNAQPGILVGPTGTATVFGVVSASRLVNNTRGIQVNDGGQISVKDSVLSDNSVYGAAVASTSSRASSLSIDNSVLNGNTTAGARASGSLATLRLSNNLLTQNGVGLEAASGATIFSYGNNRMAGNFGGVGAGTTPVAEQ